ncbi:hypothetical protein B0J12DRAFT_580612, partial [Macrophomina phaseolina]
LDAVVDVDGTVRQYIAMLAGSSYTVGAQRTGRVFKGSIQIHVTPKLISSARPFVLPRTTDQDSFHIFVKNLAGQSITLTVRPGNTIELVKYGLHVKSGYCTGHN